MWFFSCLYLSVCVCVSVCLSVWCLVSGVCLYCIDDTHALYVRPPHEGKYPSVCILLSILSLYTRLVQSILYLSSILYFSTE